MVQIGKQQFIDQISLESINLSVLFQCFFNLFFLLPQQVLTYIVVYTYSKIKSYKKSYKIFDFKSGDSTFYVICQKRFECECFIVDGYG